MGLNYVNYLNLAGFIINCAITFGASPIFGFPDNADLSERYQTIITPAGWAFAIWGFIFAFQGVFTIIQMIPKFSDLPMIQEGVKYWYFVVCIAQSTWTFLFGYELMVASTVAMLSILLGLLVILVRQMSADVSDGSLFEFWLLRFPFSLHAGWIVAASAVNVNVIPVERESEASTQLIFAAGGFVWVVLFSVAFTFLGKNPNYAIPGVGAWATLAITLELQDPTELIENTFGDNQIRGIQIVAGCLSAFLIVWCLGFGIRQCIKGDCFGKKTPKDEDDVEETAYVDINRKV